MKRITLAVAAGLTAAAGVGAKARPAEFGRLTDEAGRAAARAWVGVETNPFPVVLAAGTFVLTVGYHTARGKSLRESVAVAATRVQVVPAPAAEPEPEVVRRAKARATRAQLIADHIGLENRKKLLGGEVTRAEKDACYTEQAVADAVRVLDDRKTAHAAATSKLGGLRAEHRQVRDELAAIGSELKKLAELV